MNRSRILTQLGFAVALAASVPACVFSASGRVRTNGGMVVTEAPPAPQNEVIEARSGYVWVHGHWTWQGRWVWTAGHWERERANQQWAEGRWDQRGNQWVWVEGSWTTRTDGAHGTVTVTENNGGNVDDGRVKVRDHRGDGGGGTTVVVVDDGRPHQPPPEPRAENPGAKSGYVWITGKWDWSKSTAGAWEWQWTPGHWERARANQAWADGHWELQGDAYVWIEGGWNAAPQDRVKVRDHRH